MRVRFIGTNGSLGYRTGQVYELEIRTEREGERPSIVKPRFCPYSSWDAFWANWERVND